MYEGDVIGPSHGNASQHGLLKVHDTCHVSLAHLSDFQATDVSITLNVVLLSF